MERVYAGNYVTRERQKQLATLAVLVVAAGAALAGKNGWRRQSFRAATPAPVPKPALAPRDAIYAMLDAARKGDVNAYLACYTGQMQTALETSIRESGAGAFARYLRDTNADVKGVAVNEPQSLGDTEVKLRVEYVYQDRNEAQAVYLEKAPAGWKIARIDAAERVKTLVPYGTPVP